VQDLESELASSSRRHDQPGLVSIVVREATERPIKVCLCLFFRCLEIGMLSQ
jgi:hypothetical protein